MSRDKISKYEELNENLRKIENALVYLFYMIGSVMFYLCFGFFFILWSETMAGVLSLSFFSLGIGILVMSLIEAVKIKKMIEKESPGEVKQ
jgi:uncharacterized membrane protein YjjP (DUF1212 family)